MVNLAEVARGWLSEGGLWGQEGRSGRAAGAGGQEGGHPRLLGLASPVCRLAAHGTCVYRDLR